MRDEKKKRGDLKNNWSTALLAANSMKTKLLVIRKINTLGTYFFFSGLQKRLGITLNILTHGRCKTTLN